MNALKATEINIVYKSELVENILSSGDLKIIVKGFFKLIPYLSNHQIKIKNILALHC